MAHRNPLAASRPDGRRLRAGLTSALFRLRFLGLCSALVATSCTTTGDAHRPALLQQGGATAVDYSLWIDSDVDTIVVEACAEGQVASFRPAVSAARFSLVSARQVLGPRVMDLDVDEDGTVYVLDPRDPCIRLKIDVAGAARRAMSPFVAFSFANAKTIAPDMLLWRPAEVRDDVTRTISITAAPGVAVSVPWKRMPTGDAYRIPASTFRHLSLLAFGKFEHITTRAAGVELDIALLDGMKAKAPDIELWLRESVRSVSLATGAFPVDRLQVLVFPFPSWTSDKPVFFGMAARGGGAAAYFVADEGAPGHQLLGEWVAVHELSHLVIPFVQKPDAWLSEGLATYHQNVLRARAGLLTEKEGWFELVEGLVMAEKMAADDPRPISECSAAMGSERNFRRVYWTGAALSLMLDVQLREASGAQTGLPEALRGLGASALDGTTWTASQVLEEIDRNSGTDLGRVLLEHAATEPFPDIWPTLARLGVSWTGDAVVIDNNAPLSKVRRAIMAPPTPSLAAVSVE